MSEDTEPPVVAEIDSLLTLARAEVEKNSFRLPPVVDAEAAGQLLALCDALEARIREAERLCNPLHQAHSGGIIFIQRVMRRLMRPTLEHQARFNEAAIQAMRAEAQLLQQLVAALYPAAERKP